MTKFQLFRAKAEEPIGVKFVDLLVRTDAGGKRDVAPMPSDDNEPEEVISTAKKCAQHYGYLPLETFIMACPETWADREEIGSW